jgi:beta-amylase
MLKFAFIAVFLTLVSTTTMAVPVSVMLPLNQFNSDGSLNNPNVLRSQMSKLREAGVDGVMSDMWWGLTERVAGQYNFSGYIELVEMARDANLTVQFVLSFHRCGTNVGDECFIPLPQWAVDAGNRYDAFYRDQFGNVDDEYLSLGVDKLAVFPPANRTALDIYEQYMYAVAHRFAKYMPHTVNQIQIGAGPAGEARYPAYQSAHWGYCGVGAFQCYDSHMLASLAAAANASGHPEWGHGGPSNAGGYSSCPPASTGFFSPNNGDSFDSAYGRFFLNWYQQELLAHVEALASIGASSFQFLLVPRAFKIASIHWWYADATNSHAAETTAGYWNTDGQNAYAKIVKVLELFQPTAFDFTGLELLDGTQHGQCGSQGNDDCGSRPQELVEQTRLAAAAIPYGAENALPICPDGFNQPCNVGAFNQIVKQSARSAHYGPVERFTFLRLTANLVGYPVAYQQFSTFVQQMAQLD